jgi:L-amino acid N-acyltransferase
VTIRPATPADAPGIGAIWNAAIRDTTITFNPVEKTQADIVAAVQAGNPFFVWANDTDGAGETLGFVTYFPFRAGEGYRYTVEHSILLHPAARGQGIGRKLLTHVCDHARAAGKHSLMAVVSGENDAGLAFHQAMGFLICATLPQVGFKFGRWLDAIMLQKRL